MSFSPGTSSWVRTARTPRAASAADVSIAADARRRMRAAQRDPEQHPLDVQVRRVGELAGDLRPAVRPRQALADPAGRPRGCRAHVRPARAAIARLSRARSAATVSASAVRSSPSSTTTSPPTSSRSTGRGGPRTSAATGSAIPAKPTSSSRHSATSASAPTLRCPSSSSRPRQRAPCSVPSSSACAGRQGARPPGRARDGQRGAHLVDELLRLVGRGAVDPESDRRAGGQERGHVRDPGAEPAVGGRAVRDAGAGRAHARRLGLVEMDAVGEPHVVAEPADAVEVLQRPHAELLEAELLLVDRLGQVRVQPHATAARELGSLHEQLARDAERRRRRERDPHARAGRRVVEAVDRLLGGGEDRVAVLDEAVGRQPAVGLPEVHRAAARVEAQADRARGLDLDGEEVAAAAREDVVVVGRRRAARRRQRPPARRAPPPRPCRRRCAPTPGYSATSHSKSVPSVTSPRVADW